MIMNSMAPTIGSGVTDTLSRVSDTMSDAYTSDNSALAHAEFRDDTAIDRELAALKRNGINPILGFTGNGASSAAASATISGQAQLKAQKIAGIVNIVSSALGLAGGVLGRK